MPNGQIVTEDPELDAVRKIVHECRLSALRAEAQVARTLAEKSLEAAKTIDITSLPDIREAQAYRSALWPAGDPHLRIDFPAGAKIEGDRPTKFVLHFRGPDGKPFEPKRKLLCETKQIQERQDTPQLKIVTRDGNEQDLSPPAP